MIHTIKTQISNHPLITQTQLGLPVKRFVSFKGYSGFDLDLEHVILKFLVTLESPDGNIISTPTYLEYKLHTDVWFNALGEVVASDSPDAVITEYDYWLGQMINVAVPDGELIQTGISNLDANFQWFTVIFDWFQSRAWQPFDHSKKTRIQMPTIVIFANHKMHLQNETAKIRHF